MKIIAVSLLIILFCSCAKDYPLQPFTRFELPTNLSVRDAVITGKDTIVICGAEGSTGFTYRSVDAGISWTAFKNFDLQVNTLFFLDNQTGFAADADIIIYKTIDGGLTWSPFYDIKWPLTVNRFLRDIWFSNDSTGFVCGGKNFGNGVLYSTKNKGESWTFSEFSHEYRGICFNSNIGIMCGYGSLLKTNDNGVTWQTVGAQKYYTGITKDAFQNFWTCCFNGEVYSSYDGGTSWNKKRDNGNSSLSGIRFNCIAISSTGIIACAGPEGMITWSSDGGNSWKVKNSCNSNDIYKLDWISATELLACGEKGLYKITITD
jgi:photosystem II stability/assembly factor-like uncharacterized protein